MTSLAIIPVSVTPEAAVRIAELGFQAQVNRMIDYVRQNLPELVRIEVVLYDRYELGDEPGLSIEAYGARPYDPDDRADAELVRWYVTEFPPEVRQHIIIDYHPGAPHAG